MASAAVFWNYQGKLNTGPQNEERRKSLDTKLHRSTSRKESESSVTSVTNEAEERRPSAISAGGDSTDDEEHSPNQSQKSKKGLRRFSLDFLFSRRKSKDKGDDKRQKSKRSQSNTSTTDASENFVAYRYPGFSGAEFALAM